MNRSTAHYGPAIGIYLGRPIFKTVSNQDGTFDFDRIAHAVDGEFPLDQLGRDERLMGAGLIYKRRG